MGRRSYWRMAMVVVLAAVLLAGAVVLAAWCYTTIQLAIARSRGVYATAEEGMRTRLEASYVGVDRIDILYAGPNSFDGSQPHIWYVIAEVRASNRKDGSRLGPHGCDAPGSFFIETKKGWVHVGEGAFPQIIGLCMNVFGLAGPGRSTPSTDWGPSQPRRFCQSG